MATLPTRFRLSAQTYRDNLTDDTFVDGPETLVSDYVAEVEKIDTNREFTEFGKKVAVARQASTFHAKLKGYADAVDRDEKQLEGDLQTAGKKLQPVAPSDVVSQHVVFEIRTRLMAMEPNQRYLRVLAAAHDGDQGVLGAAMHDPMNEVLDARSRQAIEDVLQRQAEASIPDLETRRGTIMLRRAVLAAASSIAPAVPEEDAA